MNHNRVMSSKYMQWAKTHFHAHYNLANSGVTNYPLSKLPVRLDDIELTGESYYGYKPLLQAIAEKCGVRTEQVFSTLGTSLANHIAMAVLFEPGNEILIEHPTYELLISTAQYIGYRVNRFRRSFENKFQIDPLEVKHMVTNKTKLIVITNLHNPSSALTDEKTLREVGEIAKSVGAYVLVDEVYLDAAFEQTPRSSIHLGEEFIVTNSLTKVYGLSGLRCGWILAEPQLIKKMWYLNDLFHVVSPYPTECLSVIAFKNLDRIAAWTRSLLDRNRELLNQFLNSRSELEIFRPGFGTVIFPRLTNGSVNDLEDLLSKKYETAITPGKFFDMPQHFRIGIGSQPDIFKEGLHRLGKALDELAGK